MTPLCFACPLLLGARPAESLLSSPGCPNLPKQTMMAARFRPCIDLHDGKVKQIVGASLRDGKGAAPKTNFETNAPPSYYSSMYARDNLPGGHVIMLGPNNADAAIDALEAYPGGMHVGGGINPSNASKFLSAGASHVIVTSYVFHQGCIDLGRLEEMVRAVGKSRLVLDVSCRRRASDGAFIVCTDRWQRWTEFALNEVTVGRLGDRCAELLVHAVDVEGKRAGMDEALIMDLARWATVPMTYAGGVRTVDDLVTADRVGRGLVDVTVGSALDIFGGSMPYADAVAWSKRQVESGTR